MPSPGRHWARSIQSPESTAVRSPPQATWGRGWGIERAQCLVFDFLRRGVTRFVRHLFVREVSTEQWDYLICNGSKGTCTPSKILRLAIYFFARMNPSCSVLLVQVGPPRRLLFNPS